MPCTHTRTNNFFLPMANSGTSLQCSLNCVSERIYFKTALSSAPLSNFAFAVQALGTNSVEKFKMKSIWATHSAAFLAQMILRSLANGFCIKQKWSIKEHNQPHFLLHHEVNCIPIQQMSGLYWTYCHICVQSIWFSWSTHWINRNSQRSQPMFDKYLEYLYTDIFRIAEHKRGTCIASRKTVRNKQSTSIMMNWIKIFGMRSHCIDLLDLWHGSIKFHSLEQFGAYDSCQQNTATKLSKHQHLHRGHHIGDKCHCNCCIGLLLRFFIAYWNSCWFIRIRPQTSKMNAWMKNMFATTNPTFKTSWIWVELSPFHGRRHAYPICPCDKNAYLHRETNAHSW